MSTPDSQSTQPAPQGVGRVSDANPTTAAGEDKRTGPVGPLLVFMLGALTAFAPLSIDMYLPALPAISRDFGTSSSMVQLSITACLVGLAVGQVLAGSLSDRFGRRPTLLVGLAVYIASSAACAAAPSIGGLVGLRLVQGVAGAAGVVIASAVVRDLRSGSSAARLLAMLMVVMGVAPAVAPLIGSQLIALGSWRFVFVVLAGIGALLLVMCALRLPETHPAHRRTDGGVRRSLAIFGSLLADRRFLGYALTGGLVFAAMFAYIAGSPFVLQDLFGLSQQGFALVFGLNAVGIAAAGQLSARLVERTGPRPLLRAGLVTALCGSVCLTVFAAAGTGLVATLLPLFVAVASVGLVTPNATALALADHGATAGSAAALIGVCQFIIGGLIAPIVGLFGQNSALPMALVMTILAASAAAVFASMTRPGRDAALPTTHGR